jgi:tRNA modification GTPase
VVISSDTIVAVASPLGRGAVGILKISGADVPRIARAMLGALPAARRALLANFRDAEGSTIDQGIALYFPAPASFTGEHVLELQGHGGALVMDLLAARALELGCRMARPGEFSERAFLNGKIDVAQAEAVADLIDAGTQAAAKAAVRSMQGEFSARIAQLQSRITELRAYVEAAIDFPDEEIDFLPGSAIDSRLKRIVEGFDSIEAAARQGALLRDGLTVVIAGKPNVEVEPAQSTGRR